MRPKAAAAKACLGPQTRRRPGRRVSVAKPDRRRGSAAQPFLLSLCPQRTRRLRRRPRVGTVRHWGRVTLPNDPRPRILRVVTLADGATIHNAFPDRDFDEDTP